MLQGTGNELTLCVTPLHGYAFVARYIHDYLLAIPATNFLEGSLHATVAVVSLGNACYMLRGVCIGAAGRGDAAT
jgi:hypothetical protein